jgi:hypothetical protein
LNSFTQAWRKLKKKREIAVAAEDFKLNKMTEIKFSNIKDSFIHTNSHSKTAKWVLKMYFNLGVKEICCVNIRKVMGVPFCVPLYI